MSMGAGAISPTKAGTVSGRFVELLAPDWRDVDLGDVAHGLAATRRWNGQTRRPISDAEHSLLVGRLAPARYRLAALLHDGHESVFGDLARPSLRALFALAGEKVTWAVGAIKFRLDVAIARRVIEDFAPARRTAPEGAESAARDLAYEMRCATVRDADELAGNYENAVRTRDCLTRLDAFGQRAARLIPPYAPDEGETAARWLAEVKALTQARFAGAAK